MTPKQRERLAWLRCLGYELQSLPPLRDGSIHVLTLRRWRAGVLGLVIRLDGSYRGTQYVQLNPSTQRNIR